MLDYLHRAWVEVDLDLLAHNYNEIQRAAGSSAVCAVVKADAYGHGAPAVAKKLAACGASMFGVSNIDEAIQLRDSGIDSPILIFGYTPACHVTALADHHLTQCVYSLVYAKQLEEAADAAGQNVDIHVKVDTGMSRLGIVFQREEGLEQAAHDVRAICAQKHLNATGIFTHFADAGNPNTQFTRQQFQLFCQLLDTLKKEGLEFAVRHCSSSAAIIQYPDMCLDMVRPGLMLYGLYPDGRPHGCTVDLKPVMQYKSVVSYIKTIEPGATISYGCTFQAGHTMKVATVPVGYADGYPRLLSNSADVLIGGRRAPVVGRVCMDQLMVDITGRDDVHEEQTVTVFGTEGDAMITVDEVATMADTVSYEILCCINKRVPRIYIEHGHRVGMQYDIVKC